jgi:prepilin-type N-terminal cleavage/methylation domain-containing protein
MIAVRVTGGARPEAGVTLIELLIAITLVAALSTGMLMAIRSSLITMERINGRLESNRRVLGLQQIVSRQIGGVIPLKGDCAFQGGAQSLRLVTTYSVDGGARGFPRVVAFAIETDPEGGLRLVEHESPYEGGEGGCSGSATTVPLVLAGQLLAAEFSYRAPPRANSTAQGGWLGSWNQQGLPAAVRLQTAPVKAISSNLPSLTVNVAIHITRQPGVQYIDEK